MLMTTRHRQSLPWKGRYWICGVHRLVPTEHHHEGVEVGLLEQKKLHPTPVMKGIAIERCEWKISLPILVLVDDNDKN
jgi:hypothetical protein